MGWGLATHAFRRMIINGVKVESVGRLQGESEGGHVHQVCGFVLFVAGVIFIALSGYLLINGRFFDFGGIVLVE